MSQMAEDGADSRLRALGAAGLASGLASSHFERCGWGGKLGGVVFVDGRKGRVVVEGVEVVVGG